MWESILVKYNICDVLIFLDLDEARKNLEQCLSDEVKKQYFALLRECLIFSQSTTQEEFDKEARKLLVTEEQKRSHNLFILAIMSKSSNSRRKNTRTSIEKVVTPVDRVLFEMPDYSDYVQSSNLPVSPSTEFENRCAAAELFIPDNGFMSCRIALTSWENGLDKANDNVGDLMVHACQVFVKNIITAMITKKKGFKIRDKKFQYGFNQPVPDPFLRNFSNVIDETQLCKVEVDDDALKPKCKLSLEKVEQQTAFAYSCAKRKKCGNTLTVKLLYDTIKGNPKLLGLHSIHSISLFKLGLHLENNKTISN